MKNLKGILIVVSLILISFSSCNNTQRDWPGDEVKVGKVKTDTAGFSIDKAREKKDATAHLSRQSVDSTSGFRER